MAQAWGSCWGHKGEAKQTHKPELSPEPLTEGAPQPQAARSRALQPEATAGMPEAKRLMPKGARAKSLESE